MLLLLLIALFCQYSSNRRRLASGYHSRPFYYQTAESSCIYLCSRLRPSHDLGYALAAFPQYPLRSILLNLSVGHWGCAKNERVDLSLFAGEKLRQIRGSPFVFVYATVISIKFLQDLGSPLHNNHPLLCGDRSAEEKAI